jgi:hypothetical protein
MIGLDLAFSLADVGRGAKIWVRWDDKKDLGRLDWILGIAWLKWEGVQGFG